MNSILGSTDNNEYTQLPEQGTMEHTVMLTLFNAQQSVNMFLNEVLSSFELADNNIILIRYLVMITQIPIISVVTLWLMIKLVWLQVIIYIYSFHLFILNI